MAATMIEALREEVTALEAELSQKLDDTPSGVLCGSDSTASGLEEQITRNDVGAYQSSPRCLPLDNAKLKRNSRRRSGVQFEQVVASLPPAIGSGEGAVCCATASGQDIAGKLEEPSSRTPHNAMAAALAPARLPSSGSTSSVPKRTSSVDRPHRTASSDSTNSKKGGMKQKGPQYDFGPRTRLRNPLYTLKDQKSVLSSIVHDEEIEISTDARKPGPRKLGRTLASAAMKTLKNSATGASTQLVSRVGSGLRGTPAVNSHSFSNSSLGLSASISRRISSGGQGDDFDEGHQGGMARFSIYLEGGVIVFLVILDVVLFVISHLIYSDAVCTVSTKISGMLDGGANRTIMEGTDHHAILEAISMSTGEYETRHMLRVDMVILFSILFTSYLTKVLWRARKGIQVTSSGADSFYLLGFVLVIFGSIGCLLAEALLCNSSENSNASFRDRNAFYKSALALHVVRLALAYRTLVVRLKKQFRRKLQAAVSGARRRFTDKDEDVDLDLTYICDRIIAMSMPCVRGALYRNDIRDVSRFFATYHYGAFVVVNCCEAQEESGNGNYDPSLLFNQVQKYPMRDHNICALSMLVAYCEHATILLNESGENVVAVHCQGGKGRTGSFCSALMLWTGTYSSAQEALEYFANRRTYNLVKTLSPVAVTSPSQVRYVHYLEQVLKFDVDFVSDNAMILREVSIEGVPHKNKDSCNLTFVIEKGTQVEYDHGKMSGLTLCRQDESNRWTWDVGYVVVSRDVSIRFFVFDPEVKSKDIIGKTGMLQPGGREIVYGGDIQGKQLIFAQFHTAFVNGKYISFSKRQLDGAYNKKEDVFAIDFTMIAHFWDGSDVSREYRNDIVGYDPMDRQTDTHPHYDAPAMLGSRTSSDFSISRSQSHEDADWQASSERSRAQYLKLPHSLRLTCLNGHVRRIMQRLCPVAQIFERGQPIYNPIWYRHGNKRVLCYVESGNAQLLRPSDEAHKHSKQGIEPMFGDGDFLASLNFLLGKDNMQGVVYAYSKQVVVRTYVVHPPTDKRKKKDKVLKVEKPSIPLSPLNMHGLGAEDVDMLYEALARNIVMLAQQVDTSSAMQLGLKLQTKRNSVAMLANWKQNLEISAREKLNIPQTERCIFIAEARYMDQRNETGAESGDDLKSKITNSLIKIRPSKSKLAKFEQVSGDADVRSVAIVFLDTLVTVDATGKTTSVPFSTIRSVCIEDGNFIKVTHKPVTEEATDTVSRSRRRTSFSGSVSPRDDPRPRIRSYSTTLDMEQAMSHKEIEIKVEALRVSSLPAKPASARRWRKPGGVGMVAEKSAPLRMRFKKPKEIWIVFRENMNATLALAEMNKCLDHVSSQDHSQMGYMRSGSLQQSVVRHSLSGKSRRGSPAWFGASDVDEFSRVDPVAIMSLFEYSENSEHLPPAELEAIKMLIDQTPARIWKRGQVVLENGDARKTLFQVVYGSVTARSANGNIIVRKGPGETFGEWGFFNSGNRGAGAMIMAEEDTYILESNLSLIERLRPKGGAQLISRFHRSMAMAGARRVVMQSI